MIGACEGKARHPFEARTSAYSRGTSSVVLNDARILGACETKEHHLFETRKSDYYLEARISQHQNWTRCPVEKPDYEGRICA